MAEERDPKISAAYRDLGAEEPPRALDEAILAAARRSARPWTQRWAVPLSLAAVLVLSVAVTLRIQHEEAGIDAPAPEARMEIAAVQPRPAPASPAPIADAQLKLKETEQPMAAATAPAREPAAKAALRSVPKPFAEAVRDQAPAAAAPAPEVASRADTVRGELSGAAGAAEPRLASAAPQAARAAPQAAPAEALAKRSVAREEVRAETPERELERIARLRRDGRHEEADKALAEFRKRYPEFRISGAMLERVERR